MAREENGKRITALRDTLKRVAGFATVLNPNGISLRVLNDTVGDADNRKSVEGVEEAMRGVGYEGPTKLGTVLGSKIIYPMITKKAKNGKLKKPVIVVIITDGEVSTERRYLMLDASANLNLEAPGRTKGYITREDSRLQENNAFLQATSRFHRVSHFPSRQ